MARPPSDEAFTEFVVASWEEHLRQHERVTNADRVLQDAVSRFHCAGSPKVSHLIAAEADPAQHARS